MGYSVPAAIGACFANPGRDVVALPGDGAFLMTGLELITAAAYQAAPLVCVLRDGKLSQIAQFQKMQVNRETSSVLPDYDLEGFARHDRVPLLPDPPRLRTRRGPAGRPRTHPRRHTGAGRSDIDYSEKTYFTKGVVKNVFSRLPVGRPRRQHSAAPSDGGWCSNVSEGGPRPTLRHFVLSDFIECHFDRA